MLKLLLIDGLIAIHHFSLEIKISHFSDHLISGLVDLKVKNPKHYDKILCIMSKMRTSKLLKPVHHIFSHKTNSEFSQIIL